MEWIEIHSPIVAFMFRSVSTLAVEWIEIGVQQWNAIIISYVSTLAVEWIEMSQAL